MKQRKYFFMALLLVLAIVATACPKTEDPGPEPTKTAAEEGKPGGTLVFAAEQYPKCLNFVTSCRSASWLHYTALLPTMARFLTADADNNYKATDLITKIPTLENGLVTESPFTVTYELNPKAKWDDNTPITGEDVKFTWQAILTSSKSVIKIGYDKIEDVTTEGNKVKIAFKEPYAPWRDLFNMTHYILKADAFAGKPDVSDAMQTSIGFAGGPFKLESFSESEMVLVRNDNYYGKKAFLDKVIFKKIESQTSELTTFKTGEIQGFFPQPTTELVEQVKAIPGGEIGVKPGTVYEGLWFNLDKFPVNDKAVRTALLYGLDRQKAIDTIVKPVDPKATVNHCLWNVPQNAGGKWCNKDFPTKPDTAKATKALEDGGWKKGSDGIYAKGGQRLVVPIATTAGNVGREQFQTILQAQAKEIGIEIKADNSDATTLFQTRLPARDFVVGMFAQVASPDPTVTTNLHKDLIPSKDAPDGENYYGWKNDEASKLMRDSDKEVDDKERIKQFQEMGKLMAEDVMSIPLYAKPQILVYNSEKLGGDFNFNAGQLAFSDLLRTWYFKKAA